MDISASSTSYQPMIIQQENADEFQGYFGYVAHQQPSYDIPSYSTATTQGFTYPTDVYTSTMQYSTTPQTSVSMIVQVPPPFVGVPGYNQYCQPGFHPNLYAPEDPTSSLYAPEDPVSYQQPSVSYQTQPQHPTGSMYQSNQSKMHVNSGYEPKNYRQPIFEQKSTNIHGYQALPMQAKKPHVKFIVPDKPHEVQRDEIEPSFSPPLPTKAQSKNTPVYIPTPINKKKDENEKHESKHRSASPSGQFSMLEKPILPMDLADDEILNPAKRDLAIAKASEEHKKKKLEAAEIKKLVVKNASTIRSLPLPKIPKEKADDGTFRIPKKVAAAHTASPIKVSKSDATLSSKSKVYESSSTVDRILSEAKTVQEKKSHMIGGKTPMVEKKLGVAKLSATAPGLKLQSVNDYVKKVAELDKKIQELEKEKSEKKKSIKTTSTTVTKSELKKPNEPLDIESLFEDDDEPPSLSTNVKKSKPDETDLKKPLQRKFFPNVEPKKTQKSEFSPWNEKIKKEEIERDFVEDNFCSKTNSSPIVTKPKSLGPSGTSLDKNRIAHDAPANIKPKLNLLSKPKVASAQEQLRQRIEKAMKDEPLVKKPKMEESHREHSVAATVPKGESRKAHVSTLSTKLKLDDEKTTKSIVPIDMTSPKIPLAIRTRYLKIFYDEYLKNASSMNEAVNQAQLEEHGIMTKSNSKPGYLASVVSAVKKLRDSISNKKQETIGGIGGDTVSHETHVMMGRHAANISVGVNRVSKSKDEELTEGEFYEALYEKYLMKDEDLENNSYPLWEDDSKQRVLITNSERDANKQLYVDDSDPRRVCCRCGKQYRITKDGHFVSEDDCIYHWGKPWKKKVDGAWDTRYNCCDSNLTVQGCVYAECHVSQSLRKSVLTQFVETPIPSGPNDSRSRRVYSIDCEMVYTNWGPEVARVSMVGYNDETVIDEIIRPDSLLLDTNSRFSGLTIEMVEGADITLEQMRQKLFTYINSETILIGHSLESDLKALRIVHKSVVDTGVVFPHRLGPPYKKALRTLASDYLQKIIQEEESGHDSKEDSSACMQLMIYKVKHD